MVEVGVRQGSPEWFAARKALILTASRFGDALGYGSGKPWDFYQSVMVATSKPNFSSDFTRHGVRMEPLICEAYELVSGNRVAEGGFFVPAASERLHGMTGASPDGLVYVGGGKAGVEKEKAGKRGLEDFPPRRCADGLLEIKAPVYGLYSETKHARGIPEKYMIQMQAQMAIANVRTFCDFVCFCERTGELSVKRVFWCEPYWKATEHMLYRLMNCVRRNVVPRYLKRPESNPTPLPTSQVVVENRLLRRSPDGAADWVGFRGDAGFWFPLDVLFPTVTSAATANDSDVVEVANDTHRYT